jgi:hypothetical protein
VSVKIAGSIPAKSFSPLPGNPWKGIFYYGWYASIVPAFLASTNMEVHLPCFLIPFRWKDWTRAGHFYCADGTRRIPMSKTVVVNEEEFETLAEAIQDEDGWTVDESTITDPDGDVAVQLTDTSAEKGQGLAEWLILTAFVALLVVVAFAFLAPNFIEAFNTEILANLPQ